jgi:K+-transporting ATPase c subunit
MPGSDSEQPSDKEYTEAREYAFFSEPRVNVLRPNLALGAAQSK